MLRFYCSEEQSKGGTTEGFAATATSNGGAGLWRWQLHNTPPVPVSGPLARRTTKPELSLSLVGRFSDAASVRCVTFSDSTNRSGNLRCAFGLATGRVAVTAIGSEYPNIAISNNINTSLNANVNTANSPNILPVVCEFAAPGSSRACLALAHSADSSLLLALYAKVRAEPTLLVYDTSSTSSAPLVQLSVENASSIAWFPNSHKTFLAGVSGKQIKIFDIRDPSTPNSGAAIATRFSNGVCVDSFDDRRFASFGIESSAVSIWDLRKTNDPVLSLDIGPAQSKSQKLFVGSIEWCPIHKDVLFAGAKDGSCAVVWNLYSAHPTLPNIPPFAPSRSSSTNSNSNSETASSPPSRSQLGYSLSVFGDIDIGTLTAVPVLHKEQRITFNNNTNIITSAPASFAYLPATLDLIVCMDPENGKITTQAVNFQPIAKWSAGGPDLTAAFGRSIVTKTFAYSEFENSDSEEEISNIIKQRAIDGYMLDILIRLVPIYFGKIKSNIALLQRKKYEDSSNLLAQTWKFLQTMNQTSELFVFNGKQYAFSGIVILIQDALADQADAYDSQTAGYAVGDARTEDYTQNNFQTNQTILASYFSTHSSEFRTIALKMCNRFFVDDFQLEQKLTSLEKSGDFEEAAGFALFYSSSLTRALQSLNSSKDDKLRLIAATISSHLKSTISPVNTAPDTFITLCQDLSNSLKSPHLRVIFTLLSNAGSWKKTLLTEISGFPIADTVAIALRYLNDSELLEFIKVLKTRILSGKSGSGGGVENLNEVILVCGILEADGADALQMYINATGDFQSALLLGLSGASLSANVSHQIGAVAFVIDERVLGWLDMYRDLLDQWQLYHERANLDIAWSKITRNYIVNVCLDSPPTSAAELSRVHMEHRQQQQQQSQIHIRCNFCGMPISQSNNMSASSFSSSNLNPYGGLVGSIAANISGVTPGKKIGNISARNINGAGIRSADGGAPASDGMLSLLSPRNSKIDQQMRDYQDSTVGSRGVRHVDMEDTLCTCMNGFRHIPPAQFLVVI
ncbi:hypothetical protein HK100_004362 [Physocladia obscura]|uniref:MIOS-like alpha-solenoid domain-containing protein n=1 Tax=Physocladia obscura TaxID=109957 RepID=A0AAD5XJK4_9FUNG|nr:hypothetical protein HK100_004362 [Physocladia obscura]